jgi:FKBP-type peptidyl-prolyl cis-trans isomerase FklB
MRSDSARERFTGAAAKWHAQRMIAVAVQNATPAGCLDARPFSDSVPTSRTRRARAALPISLMKYASIFIAALLVAAPAFAQEKTELTTDKDKVSYSIGLDIGSTFKKQDMDIDPAALLKGLQDGVAGSKPLMTDDQIRDTMTAYSKSMMDKQTAVAKEAGAKNLAAGEKFLADNKNKEGVKTTPSGLQYKVLKEGNGPTPKETDSVETHYRGTLLDGKEFDSSYKRNEPATFPVNRVIKGWTEALQMMKVGSKYELWIPSNLAYGERGAGQDIGPNETLHFEVELLGIKPGDAASADSKATVTPAAKPK